jgi:ribosomal protein S18 acetylase RimI-like enzyme
LPAAHGLSQGLHWPYRLEDWQFLLRLGTGFVAEENGTVVGTGLCWKQGARHGSLGAIIVSPDHQGKGIGRRMMNLLLEELGAAYAGSFVRLDVTGTSGLGDPVTAIGLVQVDTVATMARNGMPTPDEGLKQLVVLNQSLF